MFYRSGWLRCDVFINVSSWCDVFDVRCILYLILYYYILYIILYSPLPLIYSSVPFPSIFLLFSSSLLFSPLLFFYHPFLPPSQPFPSQYSFYTCRYFHNLIYILSVFNNPKYLTPHVLSEGNVEWCSFISVSVLF